ncbi:MAG: acyl-CoA thioesterase [Bacteroidetes bacterium]|nr:acyl-CoA thioesterase [Bacteroidota bacterium]
MELKTYYTVRFNDCDPFNHLNNSRYLDYMLNAREDHIKEFYGMSLSDFYRKDFGWVVGSHEIMYLYPAVYNEQICIQSAVIEATPEHLLIEMMMTNHDASQLKAVLWTKFLGINIKTLRRENHPADFLPIALNAIDHSIDAKQGLQERVNAIRKKMRAERNQQRTSQNS